MEKIVLYYLIVTNIIAFLSYGIDKLKARYNKWRISEFTLIMLAAIGGSIGALAGMMFFRHKTQKPKFKYGVPAILIIHLSIAIFIIILGK